MITSPANAKVKLLRSLRERKGRKESGLYLVEGVRLVDEALQSGITPQLVLFDPALLEDPRTRRLIQSIPPGNREAARPFVLEKVADTVTPQGIVAAISAPAPRKPSGNPIVVLDAVRDPGNVGTILRTAEAAGVQTVIVAPTTVDPYVPKAVRAAMGAHFRLTILSTAAWEEIDPLIAGTRRTLSVPRGGVRYEMLDWTLPRSLFLGGEAAGSGADAVARTDDRVTIPMAPPVESLNVAAAAAVLLFEARRQYLEKQGRVTT